MRRFLAAFAFAVLLSTLPAQAQMDQDKDPGQGRVGTEVLGDGLVIPGERVGPVKLGMPIATLLQAMPPGYIRDVFPEQNVILYEWRAQGFWVSLEADEKTIRIISVFGAGTYHTDKGVQLLHPASKMVEVYGKEFRRYEYPEDQVTLIRYVSLGLQFGLVNQPINSVLHDRIIQIGIFSAGQEPPLTKAPGK